MKRDYIKKLICCMAVTTCIASILPTNVYGATWANDNMGNYYFYEGNSYAVGWRNIDGVVYYFDASGVMQKGWIQYGNSWYYLDNNGALKTGWINYNGEWYYSDSAGIMQTGILQINGQTYCFGNNGVMKKGSVIINGQFYTIGSNGAIISATVPVPDKIFDAANNCIQQINSIDTSTIGAPNSSKYDNPIEDQSEIGDYEEPARKFTVTFRDENGEELKKKTVKDGDTIKAYEPDDESEQDREFIEWNTKRDGSGKSYEDDDKIKVTSDITLYAVWSEVEEKTEVSSITISGESKVEAGKSIQLTANIKPEDATNTKVKWSIVASSEANAGKATIDENGVLTADADGIGKVTVKAESQDGTNISATKDIEVVEVKILTESITISAEGYDNADAGIEVSGDDNVQLIANILPETASKQVKWKIISGSDIATIDQNGLVKPVAANGTVIVEAIATDGSGKSGKITITVKNHSVKPNSIVVTSDGNVNELAVGKTLQMSAKLHPSDVTNAEIEWTVTNVDGSETEKATINEDGLLTANSRGSVIVRAKNGDVEGTKEIILRKDAENVKIESFDLKGQEKDAIDTNAEVLKLKASFVDSTGKVDTDVDTKSVTWSIRNEDGSTSDLAADFYSTPSSTEVRIQGKKNGKVVVKAVANNLYKNDEVSAEITIDVNGQNILVESIELLQYSNTTGAAVSSGIISSEDDLTLKAIVNPSTATNQKLKWTVTTTGGKKIDYTSSYDETTKENTLVIKPNNEYVGKVLVRAAATDGSNKYVEKTFEFARKAKNISITANPSDMIISSGQSINITADAYNGLYGPIEVKKWDWELDINKTTAQYKVESQNNNVLKLTGTYDPTMPAGLDGMQKITLNVTVEDKLGEKVNREITISVRPLPESIKVTSESGNTTFINDGTAYLQMKAEIKPDSAEQSVTWKVSDNNIAVIDTNGVLKPKSASSKGTVTVTATSTRNTLISGTCQVTIEELEKTE